MRPNWNWRDIEDRRAALATRFQAGEFSETVYRASLFVTGLRGADLDHIVREQMEKKLGQKPAGIPGGRH